MTAVGRIETTAQKTDSPLRANQIGTLVNLSNLYNALERTASANRKLLVNNELIFDSRIGSKIFKQPNDSSR